MLHWKNRTVLILAPHTDDGELGAGGTIARLIDEGCDVHYVAFSVAQDSIQDGFPPDVLTREVKAATRVLGIPASNLRILDYTVRRFFERRQDILDDVIQIGNEVSPDAVILPARSDLHQDHSIVSIEGIRAFKKATVLSYEIPWNNLVFENTMFVVLDRSHIDRKIDALREYESQAHRDYFSEEFVRAQALFRGTQVGVGAAEVFETVRMVT